MAGLHGKLAYAGMPKITIKFRAQRLTYHAQGIRDIPHAMLEYPDLSLRPGAACLALGSMAQLVDAPELDLVLYLGNHPDFCHALQVFHIQ